MRFNNTLNDRRLLYVLLMAPYRWLFRHCTLRYGGNPFIWTHYLNSILYYLNYHRQIFHQVSWWCNMNNKKLFPNFYYLYSLSEKKYFITKLIQRTIKRTFITCSSLDKFVYDKYFLFSLNLSKFWEFDSPILPSNGTVFQSGTSSNINKQTYS